MSSDKHPEKSPGGSRIYRHDQPSSFEAASGSPCIEEISTHIEQHLGKIETVFHEILSDAVHIDVHFVRPNDSCPNNRLVTSGMSDRPMHIPDGADVPRFMELMITLPPSWQLDQPSFKEEHWYWPVRLLKFLARLPHKHQTWLGWGHTIPHGDPPKPFASNTALCGAIVLPSISAPQGFFRLKIDKEKEIHFFSVVPLYEEEMSLKLKSGSAALIEKFDDANISDLFDIARPNVAKKKKWFGFM